MATEGDIDSASAAAAAANGGQSKRPSLNHRTTSDYSDIHNTSSAHPHARAKHQKHHHVGRLHGRVPSTAKGLHKQHSSSKVNLNRRLGSPTDADAHAQIPQQQAAQPHRRTNSEVKLSRQSSSSNVQKSLSQSNLKRNRSQVEVAKRNKSSDKLKRSSSGTGVQKLHKSSKSQVHFDLGSDDQQEEEDEWVDASGSNSPHLSRKGSLNSSAHSSFKPGSSAANSRPQTPKEPDVPEAPADVVAETSNEPSSPDRKTTQHKEYLTSRLLQRNSAHAAPPKMSTDTVEGTASHTQPNSPVQQHASLPQGSQEDGLTSRFVEVTGSGITSEGSFYNPAARGGSHRSDDLPRRARSMANFSQSHSEQPEELHLIDAENSALVPKPAKKTASHTAEASRTQQKLNLQRASSSIEPGQPVTGVVGVVGANPLIGVGDPGHDGGNSRDPRVGKLLERTGMEYLVVRRYQNPIVRSLNRLNLLSGLDIGKRIPRSYTASTMASRRSVELPVRHARNVSMPEGRPNNAATRKTTSIRTNGPGSSFEGDDVNRLSERLSGSSLVGGEDEDGLATLLRNLWEKPLDLSASTD